MARRPPTVVSPSIQHPSGAGKEEELEFRPCIDIHNGRVKQIVGGSLRDEGNAAEENFVSEKDAGWYASFYREKGLRGGHIILLNPADSAYYAQTRKQAELALSAWPGGLQVGGGITAENAADFLEAGASHVIVTSYVFRDGRVSWENLERLVSEAGREHLVLDLSCRKKDGGYYIVTDRWQKYTDVAITAETIARLQGFCDEFLIHAADVEGKKNGVEQDLVSLLGRLDTVPVTYAGGVGSYEDVRRIKAAGKNRLNVTVGSALDLFGGPLSFEKILQICRE
jgi:phosphoribosylformimino-5-aminoimidazole carboxamide ribotide isomerase